jgi:hypothetical protein
MDPSSEVNSNTIAQIRNQVGFNSYTTHTNGESKDDSAEDEEVNPQTF